MTETMAPGPFGVSLFGYADALGTLGLALYIGSYLALQLGLVRGEGYLYPGLNFVAAVCVLVSLMEMFNLYAALGEVAWIAISLIGMIRLYIVRRFLTLSAEEQAAVSRLVPSLPKDRARRFLALGEWGDVPAGHVLASEGAPLDSLVFLAEGHCEIMRGGIPVASIGPGSLIGEITYLTGGPATATVLTQTSSRLLRIDCESLRSFLKRNEDVEQALELAIAGDLRLKLSTATRALAMAGPAERIHL